MNIAMLIIDLQKGVLESEESKETVKKQSSTSMK